MDLVLVVEKGVSNKELLQMLNKKFPDMTPEVAEAELPKRKRKSDSAQSSETGGKRRKGISKHSSKMGRLVRIRGGDEGPNALPGRTRTVSAGSDTDCKAYLKDQLMKERDCALRDIEDEGEDRLLASDCEKSFPSGKCNTSVSNRLKPAKGTKADPSCSLDNTDRYPVLTMKGNGLVEENTFFENCCSSVCAEGTLHSTNSVRKSKLAQSRSPWISAPGSSDARHVPDCSSSVGSKLNEVSKACSTSSCSQRSAPDVSGIFRRYPETETTEQNATVDTSASDPLVIPDDLYVALDCEMVGVGPKGSKSVLARCSILDYNGNVIYDKYILPQETVTDYRTPWSGITARHMKGATPTDAALKEIKACLQNKIMIGHAVYHDFKVLGIRPQPHRVRDTQSCKTLVDMAGLVGQGNSLKKLSQALLGRSIQGSRKGHCSVEDARATLDLFKLIRHEWEPKLFMKWRKKGVALSETYQAMAAGGTSEDSMDFLHDRFWS